MPSGAAGLVMLLSITLMMMDRAVAGDVSLKTALAANKSAVQAIQTFHCRFVGRHNPGMSPILPTAGEYWRSAAAIRSRYTDGTTTWDYLRRDEKDTCVVDSRTPKGRESSGDIDYIYPQLPFGTGDLWAIGMLDSWTKQGRRPLEEAIAAKYHVISSETINGKFHIGVTKKETNGNTKPIDIWLDPAANYMVCKIESRETARGKEWSGSGEVAAFAEPQPGVFFPSRIVNKQFADGTLVTQSSYDLTGIEVNLPLAPDAFKVKYINGMKVLDHIQDKIYIVDGEGRNIGGSDRRMSHSNAPPRTVKPEELSQAKPSEPQGQVSEAEAPSSARWVILASILILVAAGVTWVIRARRARE